MLQSAEQIAANLATVRQRIAAACELAGRAADSVTLIAVSKGFGPEAIDAATAAGQRHFGESYLQESLGKIAAHPGADLTWHFIGPMQSNKTRAVAEHFDWAHSVDRLKIAQRLSEQRPAQRPPLNVCVQVNVSGEASKSGCMPAEALALCEAVAAMPNLRLRGLMAVPAPAVGADAARPPFRRLFELYQSVRERVAGIDTLSAGMSGDLEAAIMEGSTMVRIGTAIFGTREYR